MASTNSPDTDLRNLFKRLEELISFRASLDGLPASSRKKVDDAIKDKINDVNNIVMDLPNLSACKGLLRSYASIRTQLRSFHVSWPAFIDTIVDSFVEIALKSESSQRVNGDNRPQSGPEYRYLRSVVRHAHALSSSDVEALQIPKLESDPPSIRYALVRAKNGTSYKVMGDYDSKWNFEQDLGLWISPSPRSAFSKISDTCLEVTHYGQGTKTTIEIDFYTSKDMEAIADKLQVGCGPAGESTRTS